MHSLSSQLQPRRTERVLVAGAAGFIGSHLVDHLLALGYQVMGVDNLATGRLANLEHLRSEPRFQFIDHDVCAPLSLPGRLDWILHLASPASPPRYLELPIETLRVNSEGTRHLLELARMHNAGFLMASTSETYGDPQVHPQTESYWGCVNPVGPRSVYDEAKRYGEALTMAYHRRHGVTTRIMRVFNTYGPRMAPDDGRVVSNYITQALAGKPLTIYGDGMQTRSFQYVDDLIEGIVRLMQAPVVEPVNLGNPEEFTMIDLARLVLRLTGSSSTIAHLPLPQDDPRQRRPDISRAQSLLGWRPRITLTQGLERTIAHFRGACHGSRRLAVPSPLPSTASQPHPGGLARLA